MATIRPIFATGQLRVCNIKYFSDVADSYRNGIPLGVMCDVSVGGVYGLSLIARRKLSDDVLSDVGQMMRAHLSDPYSLLKKEFELIWLEGANAPGAFEAAVCRYKASLRFSSLACRSLSVPSVLRKNADDTTLVTWARDEMCAARNHEFWTMFGESDVSPNLKRGTVVQTSPRAAA